MKFPNIKLKHIIRKGLAMTLAATMLCGVIPPLPAKAAAVTVNITDEFVSNYNRYMQLFNYGNNVYNKRGERMVILSQIMHGQNNNIQEIPTDKKNSYQTDKVVWNPTQKDVDGHRDLYFLQWVNGTGYEHPGSGYEIVCSIAYVTTSGLIRYSKNVDVDDYPRKLLGLSDYDQWNHSVVNQCYFAVPDDCAQILGIYFSNKSDGGNDNNEWYMDSLTISRITSDRVSDISAPIYTNPNYKVCSFDNGKLVAFVSKEDLAAKYLNTFDVAQEWLYLLRTPDKDMDITTGYTYYAQIITGDSGLRGKELHLTVSYIDLLGESRSSTTIINESTVSSFYPQISRIKNISGNDMFDNYLAYETMYAYEPSFVGGLADITLDKETLVNDIPVEFQQTNNAETSLELVKHLQKDGNLQSYSWEYDPTTITNGYGALLFGNYVTTEKLQNAILAPKTAVNVPLNIPNHIKEVTAMTLSLTSGSANLQDVRIYEAKASDFIYTRMNGGMSGERIFYDVSDARCYASVDQAKPIYLNGSNAVKCIPNPNPTLQNEYQLLYSGQPITLMADDDNLGVQISIADLYDAGLDAFMTKGHDLFTDTSKNDFPSKATGWDFDDHMFSTFDMRKVAVYALQYKDTKIMSLNTAIELFNLMENYYKESLTLTIVYKDDFGSQRQVEVPFITSYLLQLYSDNNGVLGTYAYDHITGVFQQGQDVTLRVPLSQYSEILNMTLSFGKAPDGVTNFKNNKWYFHKEDPKFYYDPPRRWLIRDNGITYDEWAYSFLHGRKTGTDVSNKDFLWVNESIKGGIEIPRDDTLRIRSIRFYDHVTKDEFRTRYDSSKRKAVLSTTREESDYYYAAKDKNGYTFSYGTSLYLSQEAGTLIIGSTDYNEQDLKNTYLVEITGNNLEDHLLRNVNDLYVTLAYTTTGGEQKKIESKRLSSLSMDYNGKMSLQGITSSDTAYEYQTKVDIRNGCACFTLTLEDVARFDYIHLSLLDGEKFNFQVNSITIYDLDTLGKPYGVATVYTALPQFTRDFTGERVAYNNKPAALQPNKEGITFYFTKINSDGSTEEPNVDNTYKEEYLTTPPTSMTYEETLKNLGLTINKYTYTVDVKVANVMDAGSSNYFYFQLVFENGTSGMVLANQQLASDSFRQGYTERFIINTTQNYGNVTGVRVICDTTSSTSQAFDKLNIESITVTLPSQGSAKSWMMDRVGWIDINYQDEGAATTVNEDGRSGGFPNSQVVKEFARTRTASTARLLFNISTTADSTDWAAMASEGTYDAALVYEDSAGYTQQYNFDLRAAIYDYIENQNPMFLFRPNTSSYFTLSINDIASLKSLNIYRSGGSASWTIKDVSVSQFSDLGHVYRSTTGEIKRYIEDETLLTTSINSNIQITGGGTGVFTFEDNSIVMNVGTNDPAGWTTTITRIPNTAQESFNFYLYAGSNKDRTYTIDTANPPSIKGRMEYTLKEGGSSIGSTSFTFTDTTTINGTTVLKATGVQTKGMNQLKTLHLETSSDDRPIISGVKAERIRGNTIVETLYFDFNNISMNAGKNYSVLAKNDTLSSATKQTVSLQLSPGQQQLFTPNSSDIAIALLYTNEGSSAEHVKPVYSSPYVFFTDVGITALGNASILEVPFEVSGADQIVGISIVSNGPNVKFENAVVYNYVSNANDEKTMIDICPIGQAFTTSTIEKQYKETSEHNVTPITLSFTTSADSAFPGASTSGRLPLSIRYTTLNGKDNTLEIDNLAASLPPNTLPTAGSTVSVDVQLTDFSRLTEIVISASDDDWHLNKVSAEVKKLKNTSFLSYKVEAFINEWVTSRTPATAVFTGNDAENTEVKIVGFTVVGNTSKSGNKATGFSSELTNGTLTIKAVPGETITFKPSVTAKGNINNSVIWDTSQYGSYMADQGNSGLVFRVPSDSVGQMYNFTSYCSFDTTKVINIVIEVVEDVSTTPGGDTSDDGTTDDTTTEEASVQVNISVIQDDGSLKLGPDLPTFSSKDGEDQTHTIYISPGNHLLPNSNRDYLGVWDFNAIPNSEDYTVTFEGGVSFDETISNALSSIDTQQVIMTCSKDGVTVFQVTMNFVVINFKIIPVVTHNDGSAPVPYMSLASSNSMTLSVNVKAGKVATLSFDYDNCNPNDFLITSSTGDEIVIDATNAEPNTYMNKTINVRCVPATGTGQLFNVSFVVRFTE